MAIINVNTPKIGMSGAGFVDPVKEAEEAGKAAAQDMFLNTLSKIAGSVLEGQLKKQSSKIQNEIASFKKLGAIEIDQTLKSITPDNVLEFTAPDSEVQTGNYNWKTPEIQAFAEKYPELSKTLKTELAIRATGKDSEFKLVREKVAIDLKSQSMLVGFTDARLPVNEDSANSYLEQNGIDPNSQQGLDFKSKLSAGLEVSGRKKTQRETYIAAQTNADSSISTFENNFLSDLDAGKASLPSKEEFVNDVINGIPDFDTLEKADQLSLRKVISSKHDMFSKMQTMKGMQERKEVKADQETLARTKAAGVVSNYSSKKLRSYNEELNRDSAAPLMSRKDFIAEGLADVQGVEGANLEVVKNRLNQTYDALLDMKSKAGLQEGERQKVLDRELMRIESTAEVQEYQQDAINDFSTALFENNNALLPDKQTFVEEGMKLVGAVDEVDRATIEANLEKTYQSLVRMKKDFSQTIVSQQDNIKQNQAFNTASKWADRVRFASNPAEAEALFEQGVEALNAAFDGNLYTSAVVKLSMENSLPFFSNALQEAYNDKIKQWDRMDYESFLSNQVGDYVYSLKDASPDQLAEYADMSLEEFKAAMLDKSIQFISKEDWDKSNYANFSPRSYTEIRNTLSRGAQDKFENAVEKAKGLVDQLSADYIKEQYNREGIANTNTLGNSLGEGIVANQILQSGRMDAFLQDPGGTGLTDDQLNETKQESLNRVNDSLATFTNSINQIAKKEDKKQALSNLEESLRNNLKTQAQEAFSLSREELGALVDSSIGTLRGVYQGTNTVFEEEGFSSFKKEVLAIRDKALIDFTDEEMLIFDSKEQVDELLFALGGDPQTQKEYDAMLGDLEQSFMERVRVEQDPKVKENFRKFASKTRDRRDSFEALKTAINNNVRLDPGDMAALHKDLSKSVRSMGNATTIIDDIFHDPNSPLTEDMSYDEVVDYLDSTKGKSLVGRLDVFFDASAVFDNSQTIQGMESMLNDLANKQGTVDQLELRDKISLYVLSKAGERASVVAERRMPSGVNQKGRILSSEDQNYLGAVSRFGKRVEILAGDVFGNGTVSMVVEQGSSMNEVLSMFGNELAAIETLEFSSVEEALTAIGKNPDASSLDRGTFVNSFTKLFANESSLMFRDSEEARNYAQKIAGQLYSRLEQFRDTGATSTDFAALGALVRRAFDKNPFVTSFQDAEDFAIIHGQNSEAYKGNLVNNVKNMIINMAPKDHEMGADQWHDFWGSHTDFERMGIQIESLEPQPDGSYQVRGFYRGVDGNIHDFPWQNEDGSIAGEITFSATMKNQGVGNGTSQKKSLQKSAKSQSQIIPEENPRPNGDVAKKSLMSFSQDWNDQQAQSAGQVTILGMGMSGSDVNFKDNASSLAEYALGGATPWSTNSNQIGQVAAEGLEFISKPVEITSFWEADRMFTEDVIANDPNYKSPRLFTQRALGLRHSVQGKSGANVLGGGFFEKDTDPGMDQLVKHFLPLKFSLLNMAEGLSTNAVETDNRVASGAVGGFSTSLGILGTTAGPGGAVAGGIAGAGIGWVTKKLHEASGATLRNPELAEDFTGVSAFEMNAALQFTALAKSYAETLYHQSPENQKLYDKHVRPLLEEALMILEEGGRQ